MLTPNRTLTIRIVAAGRAVQSIRDDEVVYDLLDDDPFREGWFAFRTVKSHPRIDDFRVYRAVQDDRRPGA